MMAERERGPCCPRPPSAFPFLYTIPGTLVFASPTLLQVTLWSTENMSVPHEAATHWGRRPCFLHHCSPSAWHRMAPMSLTGNSHRLGGLCRKVWGAVESAIMAPFVPTHLISRGSAIYSDRSDPMSVWYSELGGMSWLICVSVIRWAPTTGPGL